MKIQLADAEARHAEHPATFRIPAIEDRQRLRQEDFAKLIFLGDAKPEAERMWVRVTYVRGPGLYVGELDNIPSFLDIPIGCEVKFEAKHVVNILLREQRP